MLEAEKTLRGSELGGEEREEGKRPSELRVLPLLANPTAIS